MQYDAKDLFQLQQELVEAKVDMAVSRAIDRVVDQITGLRSEIHGLGQEMRGEIHDFKSSMDKRLVAVETKLGISNETQHLVRTKFIEYAFKTGWVFLATLIAWVTAFAVAHWPI